jgi:hypothetical protein
MRGHWFWSWIVLALFCVPNVYAEKQGIGQVSLVEGSASVQRAKGEADVDLKLGDSVYRDDRVRTAEKSRLEIRFHDGSILRLAANTQIKMRYVQRQGQGRKKTTSGTLKRKIRVKLILGKLWSLVNRSIGHEEVFSIQTANAVAGVRGTAFQTTYTKAEGTGVKVYKGKVLVSNKPIYAQESKGKERVQVSGPAQISKQEWNEIVAAAMEQVRVLADGSMGKKMPFTLAKNDPWESWNLARDKGQGLH